MVGLSVGFAVGPAVGLPVVGGGSVVVVDCVGLAVGLAIGPGVVRAVSCDETAGSVHVSALFAWNAVTLALDDGALVEYVHVARGSSVVAVGDRVASGDKLCESGAAGFCPEPHLHLEMHLDDAKDAPSVPFRLRRRGGAPARPRAGEFWEPAA